MATQTLEFNATPGLTLTAKLFSLGSDTVVQSVSATAKTNDKGRYSAAFTDLPVGRYRLNAFIGSVGGYANETYKIASAATAKYFPDSEQQDANFPPVERPTDDTEVIEFYWPIASATFANSASTCKRRFLGETGAQEEALSGAISAISGKAGWYKIAYALADRAADATTVIPTSVTYTLVDDAGNTGELTLVIVEFSAAVQGGTTFDQAPVTSTGRLRQIIIGDDYLAANSRSFIWTVPAVAGFTPSSVVAKFGAMATLACGSYSFLVSRTGVTNNGDGTWTVSIDLPGSATANLVPGDYDWSMTLSSNGVNITKIQNLTPTDRVKVFASPS